jgi:large subunit ribosomal protein L1
MPNPKMGTVTREVARAVKQARAGSVQFRVDKRGILHAGLGKLSFPSEHLADNLRSFLVAVSDSKPENYKGKYFLRCNISSTMGPGVPLDIQNVDPTNPKFMLPPSAYKK